MGVNAQRCGRRAGTGPPVWRGTGTAGRTMLRHHRSLESVIPGSRVLVVALGGIGDVLAAEPTVRALRRADGVERLGVLAYRFAELLLDPQPPRERLFAYDAPAYGGAHGRLRLLGDIRRDRYNLALCRMKYALTQSGKGKSAALKQAEGDITIVERLFPDMGGDEWFEKYDKLLKQIQKLRGRKATGLSRKAES